VVVGLDDAVGGAALAGHIAIEGNTVSILSSFFSRFDSSSIEIRFPSNRSVSWILSPTRRYA
jgi:hypothetical protein